MSEQQITIIKTDLFTKVVLTVIAITLGVLAVNSLSSPAHAVGANCGLTRETACYVWNVV